MQPKLIIFDLDGTLYDLRDVQAVNYDMQVRFVMQEKHLSKEEAVSLLDENNVYPIITTESKSATEFFAREGLDMVKWKQFREEKFDVTKIDKGKATPENVIRNFNAIGRLILLSSNSYSIILQTLAYLGIDFHLFEDIVCSDNTTDKPFNKKSAMRMIAVKNNVRFDEMLSIGDRYQTDVLPMIELGGKGIVIKKPTDLQSIIRELAIM